MSAVFLYSRLIFAIDFNTFLCYNAIEGKDTKHLPQQKRNTLYFMHENHNQHYKKNGGKKMKKSVCLCLALIFVLCSFGCRTEKVDPNDTLPPLSENEMETDLVDEFNFIGGKIIGKISRIFLIIFRSYFADRRRN